MQHTSVTADYGANAEKLSGTVSWMLQDGQGSTRQLLNSSQTVVASYLSDAFGNSVGGSGSSANPFIWNGGSGYYSDAESGLQKVGARFYDPAVGRWISQDTLLVAGSAADSQAVNRYAYCESEPVTNADPNGHGIPNSPAAWDTAGNTEMLFISGQVTRRSHDLFLKKVYLGLAITFAVIALGLLKWAKSPWAVVAAAAAGIVAGVFGVMAANENSDANTVLSDAVAAANQAITDYVNAGDGPGQTRAEKELLIIGQL